MAENEEVKNARRFRRLPRLTFIGYNYVLVSATVLLAGILTLNRTVLFSGSLLAASVFLSFLLSLYSLANLQIKRVLHGSFTAGDLFVIQYELENRKLLFPVFHVLITDLCANRVYEGSYYRLHAEVGLIPPGGRSFASYSGRIRERGVLQFNRISLLTRFPFGVFSCQRDFFVPETIESYPRTVNILDRGIFSREVTGYSERDAGIWEKGYDVFRGIREYRRGDNPRWIDWKSSAKYRGHLRLKEFNTAEERDIYIIFDPSIPLKGNRVRNTRFELSVVYAVSMARYYIEKGNRVTFMTYQQGLCEVSCIRNGEEFRQILSLMAGIRDDKDSSLSGLVARKSFGLKRTGAGIVVIGAGITDVYSPMFRGQNIQLVDMTRENIRKAFVGSPLLR